MLQCGFGKHYNAATWASWRLKSATTGMCVKQLVRVTTEKIAKLRIADSLWWESTGNWWIDLHKCPVMRKTCLCHGMSAMIYIRCHLRKPLLNCFGWLLNSANKGHCNFRHYFSILLYIFQRISSRCWHQPYMTINTYRKYPSATSHMSASPSKPSKQHKVLNVSFPIVTYRRHSQAWNLAKRILIILTVKYVKF